MGLTLPPGKVFGVAFAGGAIAGAALAGLSGQGNPYPPAAAHLDPNTGVSRYSHHSCPAGVGDFTQAINPITVVFVGKGKQDGVAAVIDHQGDQDMPGVGGASEGSQKFYGHGNCEDEHGQAATASGLSLGQARYHMKYWQGLWWGGESFDYDSERGWYTLATPHNELGVVPDFSCAEAELPFHTHATFDDYTDPLFTGYKGGFIQGKKFIYDKWVATGGPFANHQLLDVVNWGNTNLFTQS